MNVERFANAAEAARSAAAIVAAEARAAAAARGRFVAAFSGGHSPWLMLRALADEDVPWPAFFVAQVDERVAPAGHSDRNLTHLRESLLQHAPLKTEQVLAMPVELPGDCQRLPAPSGRGVGGEGGSHLAASGEDGAGYFLGAFTAEDLDAAAASYAKTLQAIAGVPPVFDLVHLGLGPDGHTASLVPGDPVLGVTDRDVAIAGPYQGRLRMTLTYPILNRARRVVWLVTGADKAAMLPRLLAADPSIPAGRVSQDRAVLLAGV